MNRETLRIIDANFNRSREALRAMEDFARFSLNDPVISELAKKLRHDLSQEVSILGLSELLAARNIVEDVGTEISTDSESSRPDGLAVIHAAAKRLTEALRVIEEYGKLEKNDFSGKIESLRYRAYDLEKRIIARANVADRFGQVKLYVLLTQKLCRLDLLETAKMVLEGGANCLQLREKELDDSQLLDLAHSLCRLCHEYSALFLMNDRADLACLSNADGIHLGQTDLPIAQTRQLLRPSSVIGKSSHNLQEAQNALEEGADYLAVGSIFSSTTKPEVAQSGLELVQEVRHICQRPIIAIGGINASNAPAVIQAGASGVAICQAIIGRDDPEKVVRQILQAIG
jgi:thiamine-phosphate pyrophosphorylase